MPSKITKKPIRTLSLFTGAGGLDIGFHQAGYEIVACVEIERAFCETLEENTGRNKFLGPGIQVHCEDITSFDPAPYASAPIDCVIGGPPCQTFSAAGRRSGGVIGTSDMRGRLFLKYCEILDQLQPKVFVFENVYGLPGANGGTPWREITSAFAQRGYQIRAEVLDAADYGVPQHRERLIMVGFKHGDFDFPLPTHGPDTNSGLPLTSVKAAIGDLQDAAEPVHNDLGGLYGHLLSLVPEGLNYAFFTAEMGHPEPVFAWRSKFHDLLYKVNPDEPCRTIKAQPGKFTGPFHWKNRHFTVAELKRLQTFPDNYELLGSFPIILEQIGNSVPPRLAYVLATSVREQLLDRREHRTFPTRPFGFKSTFRQRQRLRTLRFKQIAQRAIEQKYFCGRRTKRSGKLQSEHFFVRSSGHFDREILADKPRMPQGDDAVFEISIQDIGSHLDMQFQRCWMPKSSLHQGRVAISGLSKYLGRIDTVELSSRIASSGDLFHMWAAIEQALVKRSQFFTLIDIYGHYANRGDTVKVKCEYGLDVEDPLHRALDYFGDSLRCGDFIALSTLAAEIEVDKAQLGDVVAGMRSERFDIRTDRTHPIIGRDRTICTYPFPLLSQKALVESRAKLLKERQSEFRLS